MNSSVASDGEFGIDNPANAGAFLCSTELCAAQEWMSLVDMVVVTQDAERRGWHSVTAMEAYRGGPVPMAALALGPNTIQIGSWGGRRRPSTTS